ncbi:MAG TPA: LytR C-terminal domain-containing protein [Jatrophihabitans sp.]|nr:LytR C-terminal domain-containing protein [Jatrophihabitans sp.]
MAVLALNHPAGEQAAASVTRQSSGAPASASSSVSSVTTTPATPSSAGAPTSSAGTGSINSAAGSGKLPLIVLNNTSNTPASVAADRFSQAGWTVTDTSTFEGAILSTAAYYDPNVAGAQAAATELQQEFPAIHRVKPKFDGLPDGPIVVVLTNDYS